MRKLSKSDKARADTLVRDGGQALRRNTIQLHCYEVTLHLSPDEFFADPLPLHGGTKPVLRLERRRG